MSKQPDALLSYADINQHARQKTDAPKSILVCLQRDFITRSASIIIQSHWRKKLARDLFDLEQIHILGRDVCAQPTCLGRKPLDVNLLGGSFTFGAVPPWGSNCLPITRSISRTR